MLSEQPLLKRVGGEFAEPNLEWQYRNSQREQERKQVQIIWSVSVLFFTLYGLLDLMLLNRGQELFALRFLILVAGGAVVLAVRYITDHHLRDWLCFACLLLVCATYALLLHERQQSTNPEGAMFLLVLGVYLFSPGRFLLVCANGVGGSLLFYLVASLAPDKQSGWLLYSYLVPANLLAVIILTHLNKLRRESYWQQLALDEARCRQQALLDNTLPASTAELLQAHPGRLPARTHDEVTVVFADIVGFSRLAAQLPADQLLQLLNRVFSCFDELTQRHGLEKIKTVGDAYMAVAGAPVNCANHAQRGIAFCRALLATELPQRPDTGAPIHLRVGVHSGPVIAGVIGRTRYAFDIWGETVNVASRLQSGAAVQRALVSESCWHAAGFTSASENFREYHLKGCGSWRALEMPAATSHPLAAL